MVGRVHEPRDLDVGDVERLAALVEVIRLAVLGQATGDLGPRDAQQVAQGVLVFVAIEPATDRPALAGQLRALRGDDRPRQALDECLLPVGVGPGLPLGGISPAFTRSCTLIQTARLAGSLASNSRPVRSSWPFRLDVVVAARAVVDDEGIVGGGGAGRPPSRARKAEGPEPGTGSVAQHAGSILREPVAAHSLPPDAERLMVSRRRALRKPTADRRRKSSPARTGNRGHVLQRRVPRSFRVEEHRSSSRRSEWRTGECVPREADSHTDPLLNEGDGPA